MFIIIRDTKCEYKKIDFVKLLSQCSVKSGILCIPEKILEKKGNRFFENSLKVGLIF